MGTNFSILSVEVIPLVILTSTPHRCVFYQTASLSTAATDYDLNCYTN
jgi:hypothetical protein